MTIAEINQLNKHDFTNVLSGIYESSPWIPESIYQQKPFQDLAEMQTALKQTVDRAESKKQLALIRAHPDLGGKFGKQTELTDESKREQSRLGLDSLDETEYTEFCAMNQAYQDKFGFPFIICVGKVDNRQEIRDAFQKRLELSQEQELMEAIAQVHEIARLRLVELIEG